jgi:hypothetical protein
MMMSSASNAHDEALTQTLEGSYLGQTPPGLTPEPFAPGIVTTIGWEYGAIFTPDMKEFYFLRNNEETDKHELVVYQNKNNQWHFSGVSPREGQPIIAPDGKTMHLGRRYKERTAAGWSERKSLGAPFDETLIMRLSASSKGTYFFDEVVEDGEGGYDDGPIQSSRLVGGKHDEPKPLSKEINSGKMNSHPFIAPDESYIIWDSERVEGFGDGDIYISYKQEDGSWGKAINMGDKINTKAWDAAASVTPDGKFLFFNRNVGTEDNQNIDIFWVDAQIIEDLRPQTSDPNHNPKVSLTSKLLCSKKTSTSL